MEHSVLIKSFRKERDEKGILGFIIEGHVKLTEEDIEKLALERWKEDHEFQIQENRNYESELEKTVI